MPTVIANGSPVEMSDEEYVDLFGPAGPEVGSLPIVPMPAFTYKTDIWRRCTDEEAAMLDDALFNAPPRLRRLWDDCNRLEHDAPEWQTLVDQAAVAFQPGRAAIVFAPSEG